MLPSDCLLLTDAALSGSCNYSVFVSSFTLFGDPTSSITLSSDFCSTICGSSSLTGDSELFSYSVDTTGFFTRTFFCTGNLCKNVFLYFPNFFYLSCLKVKY